MTEALDLFLVEDDDDEALLIRKCLERAGHKVVTCRTGTDALIVLSQSTFHLVLLDDVLPDMRGMELLRIINEERISTPVLMVTGKGDEKLAAHALRAGAVDYIAKDLDLTFLIDLPKRVVEAVTRYRLQNTNRLLIQALESARDGVMITDLQGTIDHVNRALEGMTGYSREDMIGQTPRLLKSGMHPPELFSQMWQRILSRSSWQGELINRRKDGTLIDCSVTISPIFDEHRQMTHFVGIYRDISERKQLERQLLQAQKMQSIGTLAGGIAHEFNNLLAGIQGYASLAARETTLPESTQEYLFYIIQLTDRAANLTRQLLAFARKPPLSQQPTRMDKLMQSTTELIRHTLHIDVDLEIPEQAETLVAFADGNQLQQVLINLALNARDAVRARLEQENPDPESEAEISAPVRFSLRRAVLAGDLAGFPEIVPAGDYVVLEVQDNGIGMPPDVLQQAFDPFFTTKGVGQGTGLGLAVAFGIVHGHQGFMTVDTAVGQGTCISIYLPRLTGEGSTATAEQFLSGQILEPEAVEGRQILVVDDEEAVLDVERRFLEIAGHRVACVTSGKEALEHLKANPAIDLVILDLMIPGEEGTKNLQAIRESFPNVTVLICTGLLQPDTESSLMDQAAVILRKPFRMNELWYAVHRALTEDV